MGCNTSKLDDKEAVQICKDRKKFIKQALEYRTKFASGHIAYIQSLKRVSAALRECIEGDEPCEFVLDSFLTPPLTPVKKLNPKDSNVRINYYRPSGTESLTVEERPQSPDTYRVQSYSPMHQYGGFDGFFTMQSPQRNSSHCLQSYSPYNRPEIPPPPPQNPSQWDIFWDPFSSLEYYGYPLTSSLEQSMVDNDIAGPRRVCEEKGIPGLKEETQHDEIGERRHKRGENPEVAVEDVDEEKEDERENQHKEKCANDTVTPSLEQNAGQVEVNCHETMVSEREKKEEELPGFTVYVNKRPTSMNEVIEDLESQFMIVCGAANEVIAVLEANQAHCLPAPSEVTGI